MSKAAIEGMAGELDIFEKPILQTSIVGGNWQQYKTSTALTETSNLEFRIAGSGEYYMDLARTLFNVKIQVLKVDDTALGATDDIAPVNNILDSMFSDVKVEFNQKQVSGSRNMYHYRAYFEDLFNFNNTAKDSHQTASMWFKDESGKFNEINQIGHASRLSLTRNSKVVDLAGKLHCDLFNNSKYMLNEIDTKLTLVRNKDIVCLFGTTPATAKLKIIDATLWVRKVKINPGILIAHAKLLSHHTAKYPYKRVEMHNYTIGTGAQQHTVENMFLGRIPNRIMLGLVAHSAFVGNFKRNPFNFQPYNVNSLSLFKNGEQVFSRPYTPRYGADNPAYAMPYLQSFINTGNHLVDDGYCVSMSEWQNGYCIYPFDLTPDLSGHAQHWCPQENGNLRLELGMSTALTEPVTVVVYAEFREVLEIDQAREITLEYGK
jgi:hypothetical protein